ncbi:hypothetical protein M569_04568, partial [Genlisea aurea]
ALSSAFPIHRQWRSVGTSYCRNGGGGGSDFPSFLPKEVHNIRDPSARTLAKWIQRLPVQVDFSEKCIMSSCVVPKIRSDSNPVVLLHCFDSSCLEWRSVHPLLEGLGVEAWAIDILGWGFSDLETRPPCNVAAKRYHLYQLWKSHIQRPMVLVGPSLGAAVAIDFAANYPEAVEKLILINGCVYAGPMKKLPKPLAYAMVSLLKAIPLRCYAKLLVFEGLSMSQILDFTNVGRLHCLMPWWEDSMVDFMLSGGYNVTSLIKKVKKKALVISSERDNIVNFKLSERLQEELPDAIGRRVSGCGHMPHVEKPYLIAEMIAEFS